MTMGRDGTHRRGTKLPKLSAEAKARWAYSAAVRRSAVQGKHTINDDDIAFTGANRSAVEALVDRLADDGLLVVMRPAGSAQSWFRIKDSDRRSPSSQYDGG